MCIEKDLHNKNKSGFTIVEVTLVTAFVAMLLIAITIVITNISSIFQKGLTLKEVNSVGRNLVEELTTAINAAPSLDTDSLCNKFLTGNPEDDPKKKCREDGAYKFIFQEQFGDYEDNTITVGDKKFTAQYNGVFCTGKYSYLWNTHYGIRSDEKYSNHEYTLRLNYKTVAGDPELLYPENLNDSPFRIIRIEDSDYLACATRINPSTYETRGVEPGGYNPNTVNVTTTLAGKENIIKEPVSGFLDNADDIQLDLYELVMFPPGQDSVTQRALFAGTFILATDLGNINVTRSGDYCDLIGKGEKDEEDSASNISNLGSNFNYCAINKFNFAARTAGSGI